MKPITQKECLDVLHKTPYPQHRSNSDLIFVMRFMFNLQDLAKKRGYRLFSWTEFMLRGGEEGLAGSWILSNIEPLSREIIDGHR